MLSLFLTAAMVLTFSASVYAAPAEMLDTVIVNGDVRTMDGGKIAEAVGIKDGRISFIGTNKQAEGRIGAGTTVIDAEGSVVAPGFIDLHTHADNISQSNANYFAENYLRQGVTTILGGNCGDGWASYRNDVNVAGFLNAMKAVGISINFGTLVGHENLRETLDVPYELASTAAQIEVMKAYMEKAMQGGAFGLSTGLEYRPFTSTEEVIEVARVAGQYGGFYATHMRDERDRLVEAVEETILIGKEANIPAHISHIKADGTGNWYKTDIVIDLVQAARDQGQDVTMDVYPYNAWSSGISLFLGADYTRTQLLNAIRDGDTALVAKMRANVAFEMDEYYNGDGDLVRLVSYTDRDGVDYSAKSLFDILRNRGLALTTDNLADLTIDILAHASPSVIAFGMSEENVIKNMKAPFSSIGSDGSIRTYSAGPHPRNYGTFPRVLGYFVRDIGVLTLDEALQSMTANPAERYGFKDRGIIREGYWADITVFNPETVNDNATFEGGGAPPSGIDYVLVNGVVVVDDGDYIARVQAKRPGHVLFGPGTDMLGLHISAAAESDISKDVCFTLSAGNAKNLLTVEAEIMIDGNMLASIGVEPLSGFTVMNDIFWSYAGGGMWKGTVTLAYPSGDKEGFTSFVFTDIAEFVFAPRAVGDTTVALTAAVASGLVGSATEYIGVAVSEGEATTNIDQRVFSKYDLNRDNAVDALDLGIMLLYCGFDSDSPHWDVLVKVNDSRGKGVTASMCDVNGDGVIDMLDLLDLFIHYTK